MTGLVYTTYAALLVQSHVPLAPRKLDGRFIVAAQIAWTTVVKSKKSLAPKLRLEDYTVSFSDNSKWYIIGFAPTTRKPPRGTLGFVDILTSPFDVYVDKKQMKVDHISIGM
jgi:hypothetical protein